MKLLSNALFRTLTLVAIAVFTFVFGVTTIVSGFSAPAESDTGNSNQTLTLKNTDTLTEKPARLALGAMRPLRIGDTNAGSLQLGAAESTQDDATAKASPESSTATATKSATEETPKELHKKAQRRAQSATGNTPVMTAKDKREILWLARIVYSETKRAHEQRLIAWVVRNRVDTGYTGRTYESVANHTSQFSGLQPSDNRYQHNMSRYWASRGSSWRSALKIAKDVYFAPASQRPFSKTTRHFYSPISVYDKPAWAYGRDAVKIVHSQRYNAPRFAFYSQVR